jgi:hypothetical protein
MVCASTQAPERIREIAEDRADWLLDALACATQDRRFLRGAPEYDENAGEVILMNAKKAIIIGIIRASEEPSS